MRQGTRRTNVFQNDPGGSQRIFRFLTVDEQEGIFKEISKKMKLGIVGLPNVGKSTLFNALTKAGAESANYPFCTIEPNVGVVAVPDPRLDRLAELYHPEKYTPATIEFVDIAGLVKGASKEKALETNSFPTSARWMRSSMSSAASTTTISFA